MVAEISCTMAEVSLTDATCFSEPLRHLGHGFGDLSGGLSRLLRAGGQFLRGCSQLFRALRHLGDQLTHAAKHSVEAAPHVAEFIAPLSGMSAWNVFVEVPLSHFFELGPDCRQRFGNHPCQEQTDADDNDQSNDT